MVQSNSKKRAQLTSKRDDAIAKADSLKKAIAEKKYVTTVISSLCVSGHTNASLLGC